MSKDLLLISGIYPPESGGPAIFAQKFSQWSRNHGCNVNVITYSNKEHVDQTAPGLNIHRIARTKVILWRYFIFARRIADFVDKSSCVLSIGAFIETYISSLFLGFDYVAKVPGDIVWERARNTGITNLTIEEFQKAKLPIRYRFFRLVFSRSLKRAKFVIVPSQGLLELCLLWGIERTRIHLIYNSIAIPSNLGNSKNSVTYDLLTVCRLTSWKGVDELIEYAAARKLSLVVAGDGPERANLEELAKLLEAKVTFLGEIPVDLVNELFAQSKVFVLNSYYEGLPHALVEARGSGLLSIARAGTGSGEVIHDDFDGLLIRPDRNLYETLDLVFSGHIDVVAYQSRAIVDTKNRFDQQVNFVSIKQLLERV